MDLAIGLVLLFCSHAILVSCIQQDLLGGDVIEMLQRMQNQINTLQEFDENQRIHITSLKLELQKQEDIIAKQQIHLSNVESELVAVKDTCFQKQDEPGKYQYTEYGCLSDIINLSCSDGRWINVTDAIYAMYSDSCSGCCAPHPTDDCSEKVSENRPQEWANLKYTCDNQASCGYEYRGSPINECQVDYIADYMQIFYQCLPENQYGPVGFTAYASGSYFFDPGEVFIFDVVVTNLGGHYNTDTSTFICPRAGVYMFSLNFNSRYDYSTVMDIFVDDMSVARARVDEHTIEAGYCFHAGAFAIVECSPGQTVWIRAATIGASWIDDKNNHFSGYLLHEY